MMVCPPWYYSCIELLVLLSGVEPLITLIAIKELKTRIKLCIVVVISRSLSSA
jgi:hypothetical protein